MLGRILVSQCVLHLVLISVLTMAGEDREETFGGKISIFETNRTSIKLRWKFDNVENVVDDLLLVMVLYRPRNVRQRLMMWNASEYQVHSKSELAKFSKWRMETYLPEDLFPEEEELTKKNELILVVRDLLFSDTLYDFQLKKFQKHTSIVKADITVRTKADFPKKGLSAPGCFRILTWGEDKRLVRIYWPNTYLRGTYRYKIYRERRRGGGVAIVSEGTGSLHSHLTINVGLERHYVISKLQLSHSENGEEYTSSMIIPAQESVLSAPSELRVDFHEEFQRLSWEKPENVEVTSYTIALLDASPELEEPRVIDIIYLPNNRTEAYLKRSEGQNLAFGISVDTEESSSELFIAPYLSSETLHNVQLQNHYSITVKKL